MKFWRWLLLMAVVLLIAGLSRSWVVSWFFYAMAALLALAAYLYRRPARIQGASRALSATHVEIGQPVEVRVILTWDRVARFSWTLTRDTVAPHLTTHTVPGRLFVGQWTSMALFTYTVTPTRRGYHAIGPLEVTSGDLFGFASARAWDGRQDFLTVYPRVVPMRMAQLPSNRPIGEVRSHQMMFEDPMRPVGVREYRPGDNLRRVHWKATARTGVLTSKVYEPTNSVEVCLVLNLAHADYPDGEDDIELACMTAASIAAQLLGDGRRVGLESNGVDASLNVNAAERNREIGRLVAVNADRGEWQRQRMLATLAVLEPNYTLTLARYLTRLQTRLPWMATVLLITHHLDAEAAQMLEALHKSGFSLAVAIVGGGVARQAYDRVAVLGIPVAMVTEEEHLVTLEFHRSAS